MGARGGARLQLHCSKIGLAINFQQNLLMALNDMFDSNSIECLDSVQITISLDGKRVLIDLANLTVKCEDDDLEKIVSTVIKQLSSLS